MRCALDICQATTNNTQSALPLWGIGLSTLVGANDTSETVGAQPGSTTPRPQNTILARKHAIAYVATYAWQTESTRGRAEANGGGETTAAKPSRAGGTSAMRDC